ncbi:MAG: alpha/beta hydrolase [Bacilli bacterium]
MEQCPVSIVHNGLTLRGMVHQPTTTRVRGAWVLFHGFTGNKNGSHRMMLKLGRRLADLGFLCYRFDFLGSGESDGNFEQMTVSGEVEEAKTILKWVADELGNLDLPLIVYGHSLGGVVGSIAARELNERIQHLVLLAPGGMIADAMLRIDREPFFIREANAYDYKGNLLGEAFFEDLKTFDAYEAARGFSGNVLIIHGDQDETVPLSVGLHYQRYVYHDAAQFVVVNGADHSFNAYHWEREVFDAVEGFIQRNFSEATREA